MRVIRPVPDYDNERINVDKEVLLQVSLCIFRDTVPLPIASVSGKKSEPVQDVIFRGVKVQCVQASEVCFVFIGITILCLFAVYRCGDIVLMWWDAIV